MEIIKPGRTVCRAEERGGGDVEAEEGNEEHSEGKEPRMMMIPEERKKPVACLLDSVSHVGTNLTSLMRQALGKREGVTRK